MGATRWRGTPAGLADGGAARLPGWDDGWLQATVASRPLAAEDLTPSMCIGSHTRVRLVDHVSHTWDSVRSHDPAFPARSTHKQQIVDAEEAWRVRPKPPVRVLDLFSDERRHLLTLLSELSAEQWTAPTECAGWSVKDLVAHLLGDDMNRLAGGRDGYRSSTPSQSPTWEELVAFVNGRNEAWVIALRRLSPQLLIDLLSWTGDRVLAYFQSLDPMEVGDPVSWAGPTAAPRWLDMAREYTERWVHQQQIRVAVGAPGLRERRLFHPVLDTFVHALPHTYREVAVADGSHVRLVITGEAGGAWSLLRAQELWALFVDVKTPPTCVVTLDEEAAWRLFTRGIDAAAARKRAAIEGDEILGAVLLRGVAIIA